MISNLILLMILSFIIFIFLSLSSRNRRIKKVLKRNSNYTLKTTTKLTSTEFCKVILSLARDFKYSPELINLEDNVYVMSDRITMFTYGYYYLLELKYNIIVVYLVPRFFMESMNIFGKFDNSLNRIVSIVRLIESDMKQ